MLEAKRDVKRLKGPDLHLVSVPSPFCLKRQQKKKKKKNRKSVIIINWFEETLKDVTNCINKFEFSP